MITNLKEGAANLWSDEQKSHQVSKFEVIENEAHKVYDRVTEAYSRDRLTLSEYENIVMLCNLVAKEIGKKSKIKERLVEIMRTEVLLTLEERGIQKGIEKGTR